MVEIGEERRTIHGTIDDPGCVDPIVSKGGDESERFPMMGWTPPAVLSVPT